MPEPTIRGDGFLLRAWQADDLDAFVEACGEPDILRHWRDGVPLSRDEGAEVLEELSARLGAGRGCAFAIVVDAAEPPVGYVGVDGIDQTTRAGEVSFWLTDTARGKGLAARGLALLARWAPPILRLGALDAYVESENVASIAVVERAGWRRVASFVDNMHGPAVHYRHVHETVAPTVSYEVRAAVDFEELNALFGRAWGGDGKPGYEEVLARSFTWITAKDADRLVGFVNVAWDGGVHFFLLDTTVDPVRQGSGVGGRLVKSAIEACRGHGEWMHVDSSEELMTNFYAQAGFRTASAGLVWVGHR